MGKKARSLLKISAVFFGTVLGAGFASGQELLQFFVRFRNRGVIGILMAGALFGLLGAQVLSKSFYLPEKTPTKYLETVFKKPLAVFLSSVMEFFLAVCFCVMLSGAGAYGAQRFSLPPWVGILVTDALCLLIFMFDLQGLSLLNLILTPVMLTGMVYVCLFALFNESRLTFLPALSSEGRFLPYALFYVGYNMLTATAVLVPASALADNEKTAKGGGILGGLFLTVTALLCVLALSGNEHLWNSPLPLLLLSEQAGQAAYVIYSVVLYAAMLTTAVSSGFSVVGSLSHRGTGKRQAATVVCLAALPLSFVPFAVLVRYLYVFFGVLGVVLIVGILWDWYKQR